MFCRYCGNELPENANFCPNCGQINESVGRGDENASVGVGPSVGYNESVLGTVQETIEDRERDNLGGEILKYSILGLSFGVTFWFSLIGFIFSIIARVKLGKYVSLYKETRGRASVGKGLCIGGLIVGGIFVGIGILYVVMFILALVPNSNYGSQFSL